MKAIIKEDIIIRITEKGDTEIGVLPKSIDLSILRFDGNKVVSLLDLNQIWVRFKNNQFELHAIEVINSQLVNMTYQDRKKLIYENKIIRVKTSEEINNEKTEEFNQLLKNNLRIRLKNNIGDTPDLVADISKLVFLLIIYSRTQNSRIGQIFDRLIPIIKDVYSIDDIEEGLVNIAQYLKSEMPEYYTRKK